MKSTKVSFICTLFEHDNRTILAMIMSLANCLQYCPYLDYDIILVENDGKKRETALFDGIFIDRTKIKIICSEKNTGYCGGNNLGISNSNSEYIIIVNPDIVFKESILLDWLIAGAKISNGISGRLVGTMKWYTFPASFPIDKKYDPKELPFYFDRPTHELGWLPFRYIDGQLMCFSRELFNTVGGFDENMFPGYFGENTFVFQAYLNGFSLQDIYADDKYYEHRQNQNKDYKNKMIQWTKEGREYFYEHHALPNWDKFIQYLRLQ